MQWSSFACMLGVCRSFLSNVVVRRFDYEYDHVRRHSEHLAVCPLVADETDAGMEAPATGLAPESGRRIGGVASVSTPAASPLPIAAGLGECRRWYLT